MKNLLSSLRREVCHGCLHRARTIFVAYIGSVASRRLDRKLVIAYTSQT